MAACRGDGQNKADNAHLASDRWHQTTTVSSKVSAARRGHQEDQWLGHGDWKQYCASNDRGMPAVGICEARWEGAFFTGRDICLSTQKVLCYY